MNKFAEKKRFSAENWKMTWTFRFQWQWIIYLKFEFNFFILEFWNFWNSFSQRLTETRRHNWISKKLVFWSKNGWAMGRYHWSMDWMENPSMDFHWRVAIPTIQTPRSPISNLMPNSKMNLSTWIALFVRFFVAFFSLPKKDQNLI